jgi:hypothetical protein
MASLFGDAGIMSERFLLMTKKSLIAVRAISQHAASSSD